MNHTNPEKIFEALVSFIRDEIGENKMNISKETLIENDLGVTGDEATELIQKFSKKFNVNINEFKYEKYFYPEPSLFNTLHSILPLTVGDLEKSILFGKLDETVIGDP